VQGLLLLLCCILDGDDRHDLALDLCHLRVDGADDLVDRGLIVLVEQGQGEEPEPGHDDQGHHVEPGADVGEAPEAEDELEGVEPVLEEEEAAELHDGGVGHVHEEARHLGHLLGGDVHLKVGEGHQGVAASVRLFHENHGIAVDFDAEDDDEEGEGDVGDDGDEAEVADGDEAGEDEAEGAAAGHGVHPVHQVLGGRLHGGQVNHGGGWLAGAGSAACSWLS